MSETEKNLWLVEFENNEHQPVYILAETEKQAWNITRRMFDRRKYNFDWSECVSIQETNKTNPKQAVRGGERPFRAIVPHKYHMVRFEKRVNQAGSKGVYYTNLNY